MSPEMRTVASRESGSDPNESVTTTLWEELIHFCKSNRNSSLEQIMEFHLSEDLRRHRPDLLRRLPRP
jgi:hypothetical protein